MTVGYKNDGKTITWSKKKYNPEYPSFQLPCSKCIECRLDYARTWAIRSVHESKMYQHNSFVTLTYTDEKLPAKLHYPDFQNFIKRLRSQIHRELITSYGKINWSLLTKEEQDAKLESKRISIFSAGEYGDKTKRPHWHALIVNWRPEDCVFKYTNHNGDPLYSSTTLDNLWGSGITETGDISFKSAAYVARYAAKKLVHKDEQDIYETISKKSAKHAIGKKWLEQNWRDIFNYGILKLDNGQTASIPRYYEKWLAKNQPEAYLRYMTEVKAKKQHMAELKNNLEKAKETEINNKRLDKRRGFQTTKLQARKVIVEKRFKLLQQHLKGDI